MVQLESGSDRTREDELESRLLRLVSGDVIDLDLLREIVLIGQTSGNFLSNTPLSSALSRVSRTGNVDAAKFLLDHGANADEEAKSQDQPALLNAVIYKNLNMVELLLDHSADINVCDSNGRTALMTAAWNNSHQILSLLIARGADVNAKDLRGRNVLHNLAADKQRNWTYGIVELLLNHKELIIDTEGRDGQHRTPLHWACIMGHERLVQMLLAKKASVDAAEAMGKTGLYLAVAHDWVSIARILLQHGANVNSKSDGSWSPLHRVCEAGSQEMARLLLEAGADVNVKLADGSTPLHLAAINGRIEILRCLLESPDIKVGMKDKSGLTALHQAAQRNQLDCLRLLNQDVATLSEDALGSSKGFHATIVDFYKSPAKNKVYLKSVYDLLYGQDRIWLTKLASEIRPTDGDTRFRWIHLPANNIAWVEKLMVNLFIEDGMTGLQDLKTLHDSLNHQHGGHRAHSWFMQPSCQVIPTRMRQDSQTAISHIMVPTELHTHLPRSTLSGESRTISDGVSTSLDHRSTSFFLYLPYLHYETESRRREMEEAILKSGRYSKSPSTNHPRAMSYDEMMIRGYLTPTRVSLHVRRTLDQYFYPNSSTVIRDRDQVIGRYQAIQSDMDAAGFDPRIIMVDQLWLWVIDDNLIITAFPQRWQQPQNDALCVLDGIIESIVSKRKGNIMSVYDLATSITTYCSSVFTKSVDVDVEEAGDDREQYQFLQLFDASLGRATDRESALFQDLRVGFSSATDSMQEARGSSPLPGDLASNETSKDTAVTEKLLRIDQEIDLLIEIKDIRDELDMLHRVLDDHRQVLPELEAIICDRAVKYSGTADHLKRRFRDQRKSTELHMRDVDRMDRQAERIYRSIVDMLDLKQKHASNTNAFEAKFARQQAEGSAKQNQILMVFTIVTIIFLPLSFIAGFFTINIREFSSLGGDDNDGSLPLAFVLKYIFGVGLAVSIPMIVLALNLDNFLTFYDHWKKKKWTKSRAEDLLRDGRESLDLMKVEEIIGSAGRNGYGRSLAGRQRRRQAIS